MDGLMADGWASLLQEATLDERAYRPSARGKVTTFYAHRIDTRPSYTLDNTNAADVHGLVAFSQSQYEKGYNLEGSISTFRVTTSAPFGQYTYFRGGKAVGGGSGDRIGMRRGGGPREVPGIAYSFPAGGKWSAKRVAVRPTEKFIQHMEAHARKLFREGKFELAYGSTPFYDDLPRALAVAEARRYLEQ